MTNTTSTDLAAAENMLEIQLARLKKARLANNYHNVCAALRALQEETENASRIAANLHIAAHLEQTQRISRCVN